MVIQPQAQALLFINKITQSSAVPYYFESSSNFQHGLFLPASSPLRHILLRRPSRIIRRSQIALVERAYLVGRERPHDCMQHATVMEQHQVVLAPVVWVYELYPPNALLAM